MKPAYKEWDVFGMVDKIYLACPIMDTDGNWWTLKPVSNSLQMPTIVYKDYKCQACMKNNKLGYGRDRDNST